MPANYKLFSCFKMGGGLDKQECVQGMEKDIEANRGEFYEIIAELKKQQNRRKCVLNVDRSLVWQCGISFLKEPGSEFRPLDVKFQTGYTEEDVLNLGGPNREFFTLLFEEFRKPNPLLETIYFIALGKRFVISMCGGGGGFPYFPPFVIKYLRDEIFEHELSTLYIVNTYLKDYIDQLNNAETQDELDKVVGEETEKFMENCGWPPTDRITMESRLYYIQTLIKWDLFDKRESALKQIKEGLRTLNFLDLTKTLSDFEFLLLHRNNEAAYMFQFLTGLDDVPVHEFPVQVEFNRSKKDATLPEAITCVQLLRIPLGNSSKMEFYSSFHKALTFGRVGFSEKTMR
ncbi:hypothetical protein KUTeg_023350 [Tegillarca granosa]|uniref:HECT domain-containing protein n=1 Tax=Tegillarca granosa TaxID=220873 RepID=A0ABQ9E740_TEGGR|nr:hypothetical protein KUTeg_023350 [Tegillarca granosa]